MREVTRLLDLMNQGDAAAEEQLLRVVHDELKRIATAKLSRERPGHTLQTTALVNEAYIRLTNKDSQSDSSKTDTTDRSPSEANQHVKWDSRGHFFAAAAEAMRRILVDNARRKKRLKRGGDRKQVEFDEAQIAVEDNDVDIELLDQALAKLEKQNEMHAAVVKLRYFAGITIEQTAEALGVSPATVKRSWAYSKAWLKREIG